MLAKISEVKISSQSALQFTNFMPGGRHNKCKKHMPYNEIHSTVQINYPAAGRDSSPAATVTIGLLPGKIVKGLHNFLVLPVRAFSVVGTTVF